MSLCKSSKHKFATYESVNRVLLGVYTLCYVQALNTSDVDINLSCK